MSEGSFGYLQIFFNRHILNEMFKLFSTKNTVDQ
jgi:hypothetical protein